MTPMKSAPRADRRSWTRFFSTLLLGGLGYLATAGCTTLPEPPGRFVDVLYQGNLEEVQPVDVVVLPVINNSGNRDVPENDLRSAFYQTLPRRRYSPISLDFINRGVAEASYNPGALQEDAVLKVVVRKWDLSRWESDARLTVEVEAWMLSAVDGSQMWGGRLSRTLKLKEERERHETSYQAFLLGCQMIAEELLEVMPAHNPQP
jgi:hypothetical protein